MAAAVAKNKYVNSADFPAVLQRVYRDIASINDSTASTDAKVAEIIASAISEFFPVEIGTGGTSQGITAERPSVLALADGSTKPDESYESQLKSKHCAARFVRQLRSKKGWSIAPTSTKQKSDGTRHAEQREIESTSPRASLSSNARS